MKNLKIFSSSILMLICFLASGQEITVTGLVETVD